MGTKETWELLSFVVTVFALPVAIVVFLFEQRRERNNEEEEEYQLLADAYTDFLKVVLANADLQLRSRTSTPRITAEQEERRLIIFDMLISLFERAYLVAYQPNMTGEKARRWNSWDDYMREWCRREDFLNHLPVLLRGEDPAFSAYIMRVAEEERVANAESGEAKSR
ncbi:MAG: hypothetical protein ABI905_09270 [Betaproteobacteria bacterium]